MTRCALLLAGAGLAALAPAVASVPGGGPRLEDFRIDDRGTVTQPAPAPSPAPTPAPVSESPPTASNEPATARAPRAAPPRPRRTEPAASAPAEAPERPAADIATPAPEPVAPPVVPTPSTPAVSAPQPESVAAPPTLPQSPEQSGGGPIWPWLLVPLALLGIGGVLWLRRARPASAPDSIDLVREPPREAPTPAPLLTPSVPAPRPRIELALEPEAATLQDGALEVRFLLHIANTGDAVAEDIRVASKLLSGGREVEDALAGFYADALTSAVRLPQSVPAGATFGLRGRVRSKGDALRALQVRDRALLVPLVAINLRYRWAEGEGQTAQSFVLGRELDPPAERMAPLPATASPRVYRGLGTRPHALAKVA